MSAAVVGVKRSIEDRSDFRRKKSRCGPARYDAPVVGFTAGPSPEVQSFMSTHQGAERGAASVGLTPEGEQELCSHAYEVSTRFPRVPATIIQSLLKGNVSEACHMIENLTGPTGCRWTTDADRSQRPELHCAAKSACRVAGESDSPGHTSMEELSSLTDATEDSVRTFAQRMVSTLQGSNSVEEATSRILPLLREFKCEAEAPFSRSAVQLEQEIRNLRHNQQVCTRALKSQHEKLQILMAKWAAKSEKEKQTDSSLTAVKDENRKLRRMNEELQFFLSSTNNATSEHIFCVRRPDVC